jgi:hypothetical protein
MYGSLKYGFCIAKSGSKKEESAVPVTVPLELMDSIEPGRLLCGPPKVPRSTSLYRGPFWAATRVGKTSAAKSIAVAAAGILPFMSSSHALEELLSLCRND